ncbi:hypothetical protein EKO27_g8929 [Xylaria grammica]|uniref:Uncharacterized protein n=1 Tax=Xylaria grammica TaxID=363999 RepID=A0A439CVI6_9PEZI|nr:hypothetical protein EKO27_g8929 [Xylaria grammica]
MGPTNPIFVVGMVRGRRHILASFLATAYPERRVLQVTNRILTYLSCSRRYLDLELAWAETAPDHEWGWDAHEKECSQCKEEPDRIPEACEKGWNRLVPMFPVAATCLFLGMVSANWNSWFLRTVDVIERTWTPQPGDRYMWEPGCTVIDVCEGSYAFVLPAEKMCSWGKDQPYPARQLISGHRWLRAFGLHEDRYTDVVWNYETCWEARVMLKEALQEVLPSLLWDGKRNSEEERDESENEDENEAEAPASRKRAREPDSFDENLLMRSILSGSPPDARAHGRGRIADLVPNKFRALSGGQVVELAQGVVAHNAKFSGVEPEHVARILDVTGGLGELIIWDNPTVRWEEVAGVADGRIAKFTSRAGFLAPWQKWITGMREFMMTLASPPLRPTHAPTRRRSRRTWPACVGRDRPLATLSLEDLDLRTLVMLLHTKHSSDVIDSFGPRDPNRIFAELVALPLHEAWAPLAEFYTSVARFEEFMSHGQATAPQMLTDRWPLAFALMMGTGNGKSEYAVSSPIASEAFKFAQAEKNWGGRIKVNKPLRIRGFDPVLPGEHTLVLLREPNLGRLR